jgi:predicted metal-dependent hydrolase
MSTSLVLDKSCAALRSDKQCATLLVWPVAARSTFDPWDTNTIKSRIENIRAGWAVRHWAARIGVKSPQVYMRHMRTKWASISTVGRLTLNVELMDLPRELGEFVIVHELIHMLAPNHGKVFKSFMYAYLPDWELRRQAVTSPRRIV